MQLIEKFHKMESENALFELGKEKNIPIWDIIRYSVFVKYYYPEEDRTRLNVMPKHSISDYFGIILQLFISIYRLFFIKGENIILTSSKYVQSENQYFDKIAMPIIRTLGENCLAVDTIAGKNMPYKYIYNFNVIFRRLLIYSKMPFEYYSKINDALLSSFGINLLTYNELNKIVKIYKCDHFFYKFLFSVKKTKRLIICLGNPKAAIHAANDLEITTYLVQHAGIEYDEIEYSYPKGISINSNILFAKYVLTFGDYWCKNINVPSSKIISIGNDYFYSKPKIIPDKSILIISTIIHGRVLSELAIALANQDPRLKIVYKLHPNEFHFKTYYINLFKDNFNIKVITNETETNILIAKSQCVVLIVSAVIYESLNQNKKVAILKKINYERQITLSGFPNVYFFDTIIELKDILIKETIVSNKNLNFYKKSDYSKIELLLK